MQRQNKPAWKDVMRQEGIDDMTLLSKVTNEQIRDNLLERYQNNIIYTSISDVLISMNPYKQLPIYGQEIVQDYVGRSRIELPPHIFSIAEESFRTMLNEKENQCIIISGESGAGKTEAAKKIMFYIAEVTGGGQGSRLEKVKNIILETNPLLEAFGNAKTLRNNNSSRFGKYFELHFTQSGDPDGGVITNYLLEKSRVVFQIPGERNFHIFYQFCAGATGQEKQNFGVSSPDGFAYLTCGGTLRVDGIDDVSDYKEVRHAMNVIGISQDEQNNIFKLLSAIMWLGNLTFKSQGEKAFVADKSVLDFIASLLSVPPQFLQQALEVRKMETKHGNQRGTSYNVPLNFVQASATRDGVAKAIFSRLFDWLVQRLNQALIARSPDLAIGVLDIYGFEVFEKNSFEQLCINYVNEKLQQIFIQFTLKNEQDEYVREGIKWTPIEYFNNKIVCDLIEEKSPPGIFPVLDDVCRSVHAVQDGADKALSQRLTSCNGNPHFNMRGQHFLVKHYAGDVTYEIEGMVEKNKDALGQDLVELLQLSTNKFLANLFPEQFGQDESKKAPTTAGYKIRTSANDLVKALTRCTPHYVRCLKPNDDKAPDYFEPNRVMHQIRYLGLLDNVKVRRSGFAYRSPFKKFMERYFLISGRTSYAGQNTWNGDELSGCKAVLEDAPVGKEEWQIGKTKVFLRHPETLFAFEDLRVNYYHNMVSRIKNAYRLWKTYKDVCINRIKNSFRVWKTARLEAVLGIQRCYRAYKEAAPFMDLKLSNESLMQGRKERHRYSLTSVRKFFGDYLDMKTQGELLRVMGPGANEPVLFSAKCRAVIHPGIFSSPKLSPRFLCVTQNSIYLIKLEVKKQLAQYILERQVPTNSIVGVSMSTKYDNFIVLHNGDPEGFDICIETDFKTELLAWLNTYGAVRGNVTFSDKIRYTKKKKSAKEINFIKDTTHKFASENPFYKSGKVLTSDGMPPNSQVAMYQYRMYGPPKPVYERPKEQMNMKKGNATGALRGTTRAGVGAKNEVALPSGGSSAPARGSGAPRSRGPSRGGPPSRGAPTRGAPAKRAAPPGPARGGRGPPPSRGNSEQKPSSPPPMKQSGPPSGTPRGAPRGAPRARARGGPGPRGGPPRGRGGPGPRG